MGKGRVVRTSRIPTRAVRSDSSIASSFLLEAGFFGLVPSPSAGIGTRESPT